MCGAALTLPVNFISDSLKSLCGKSDLAILLVSLLWFCTILFISYNIFKNNKKTLETIKNWCIGIIYFAIAIMLIAFIIGFVTKKQLII